LRRLTIAVALALAGCNQVLVMYSSRPTIQDRFGIAQPLEGVPLTLDHLNDDCSRVYFSGLESVFFVQRR